MKKNFLLGVLIVSFLLTCSPDDGGDVMFVEDRDRTEQQAADRDSLLTYLNTHYYNKTELATLPNPTPSNIVLIEESDNIPDGFTRLADDIVTRTTTFLDTDYEYYILKINQGGGEIAPKFTDEVRTLYEGSLVTDATIFDSAVTPADFNLTGFDLSNTGATIRAWTLVFPEFNTAESVTPGATTTYNDFGLGVMFIPSGLAYFSRTLANIPSYSNLIFKFALLQSQEVDHDNDGIPSYIEDLNNNLDAFDDNTDEDAGPNYLDTDDDNDGVATINELVPNEYVVDTNNGETEPILAENEFLINRNEVAGVITINTVTIVDANSNGTADYLEEEVTTNYNEE